MVKADKIAGLECSADALVWAAEVLRVRFDEIVNLRSAELNFDDIEALHNMRVATRRLRSALRDFALVLRKSALKSVNNDLKMLSDSLGAARDLDVAIVALEKLKTKAGDNAVKAGIQKLVDEKREKRQAVQLDLIQTLSVSVIEDLQKRFYAAVEKAARPKKRSKTISFTNAGRAAVFESLQKFCDLSASLYAPYQVKKLHKLRISAKRLRYAIELFTACWGEHIEPFAEEIAEMQSYLGEVHDADKRIESFTKHLLKNDEKLSQTNIWLLSRFVKIRTMNYRNAIKLWSKWKNEHFIEKLRELTLSAQ